MKKILKEIIFRLLNIFFKSSGRKAGILMYHSVSDKKIFNAVIPKNFEKHLIILKKQKRQIVKLSDFVRMIKEKKDISNFVCLTFDDGFEDNYKVVFPLLKKYKIPATIFLATGLIGKSKKTGEGANLPILSKEQIREMVSSGLIEFMPHTKNHKILTKIDFSEAVFEIEESKNDIVNLTGGKADIFAPPKGKISKEVLNYLKKNNWSAVVSVKEGLVSADDDFFSLKRNSIDKTTTIAQFKGKISGSVEVYNKLKFL